MKLDAFVESYGCTLERLLVNDPFIDPKYEVFAPVHKCFDIGLHSLICVDAADVRLRLKGYGQTEDCSADCECRMESE